MKQQKKKKNAEKRKLPNLAAREVGSMCQMRTADWHATARTDADRGLKIDMVKSGKIQMQSTQFDKSIIFMFITSA